MRDILAVILGGGRGTRLHPLTEKRSKPAVPLAGKYRLIDIPVSNCINSGIDRMFVLTQYNSASLNRHLQLAYRFDRFRGGFVSILAAEQTAESEQWFQGTADAVRQGLPHIDTYPHSHMLILSGDQLYRMDYQKMLAYHEEKGADITVATIPVVAEEAPAFGILKMGEDGSITEFHEKPPLDQLDGKDSPVEEPFRSQGRKYLASMGIYLFSRKAMREVLEAAPDANDFGKQIIPDALDSHRVVAYPFDGYWSDIGTVGSFYEANIQLARRLPDFDLYDPARPIYTNARMLPPAKIEAATVRDSMIGEAAVVVGATVEDSVVGIRSYVGRGATLKRVVMLGADYYPWQDPGSRYESRGPDRPGIGENAYIEGAIIDKNVAVGSNARITNQQGIQEGEGDWYVIRDGVVVLPKNATVPDNVQL